jgi:hypothetical protein
MVLRLSRLMHQIAFVRRDILLDGVISFLVVAIITGHNGNAPGTLLLPFLPPLTSFLAPLTTTLDGVAQPALAAAFMLPRTNAAPTTSSPEACRVAIYKF